MSDWWSADPVAGATEFSAQSRQPSGDWWANDPVSQKPEALPEMQGPKPAPVGAGEAIGRGVRQGAMFNFGDEVSGLQAASGLPERAIQVAGMIPGAGVIAPAIGAARLGYEAIAGGDTATNAYNRTAEAERARNQQAEAARPYLTAGGQVAGALAIPVGAAANVATLPGRMAVGAGVGAATGALAGAGEGENAVDRAGRAAIGAGVGSAVGGAAPVAIRAVEGIGRGIAAAAAPVTNRIRGAVAPEGQAARTAAEFIERDAQRGASELTQAEIQAAQAAGQPVANLDRGGEATRGLARWAANISPEARDSLQKFADARFEGQSDRVINFLRNLTGGSGDSTVLKDSLRGLAQIENRPAYFKAYNAPGAQAMWDEGFEQIAQAPVVQNAIRVASVTGANRATVDGFPRVRSPFVVDKQTGQLTLRTNEDGSQMLPNLQFWDHVKRNLDKISTPEAKALNSALKEHLDNLVPSYRDARAGAAKAFGAEDAIDAGQKFVTQNMAMGEASKALSKMSPHDRDLFKIGFANKMIDDMANTRDRINVMNKINATPNARAKLQMVLGADGYKQFDALMTVEQSMDKLRGALGNSSTVRQWVELGLAGSVGTSGLVSSDPTQLGIAAAIAGRRYVDQAVAKRIAEMLVSSDPNVLSKGIKAVAGNKNLLRAFRDFDAKLSSVGAQQAAPVVNVNGMVRADSENPARNN